MSAAAIRKAERANIDWRASVDDRLADGKYGVLLLDSPEHMHGDPAPRKQRVDHESIARIDDLLTAKIENDKIFVNTGAAQDLFTKLRLLLAVQVNALLDVRQSENLLYRMISTVIDQLIISS